MLTVRKDAFASSYRGRYRVWHCMSACMAGGPWGRSTRPPRCGGGDADRRGRGRGGCGARRGACVPGTHAGGGGASGRGRALYQICCLPTASCHPTQPGTGPALPFCTKSCMCRWTERRKLYANTPICIGSCPTQPRPVPPARQVFTELGLARRSTCCGNGCRHCPWAHYKVVGRPRANRLRTPALLRPSPGARTVPQVQVQLQQQQPGGWKKWFGGRGGSSAGPEHGACVAGGRGGGADGGVLLVCYEPGPATGALIRAMRGQTGKQVGRAGLSSSRTWL